MMLFFWISLVLFFALLGACLLGWWQVSNRDKNISTLGSQKNSLGVQLKQVKSELESAKKTCRYLS